MHLEAKHSAHVIVILIHVCDPGAAGGIVDFR